MPSAVEVIVLHFHTIKSILNSSASSFNHSFVFGFPYYKVYFKPNFSNSWYTSNPKFPYYKVYFKLEFLGTVMFSKFNFHTIKSILNHPQRESSYVTLH